MDTEIGFLRQLETDLEDAADRESARPPTRYEPPRRRRGASWVKGIAAAAAVLVLAFGIGSFATLNHGSLRSGSASSAAGEAIYGGSGTASQAVPRALAPGTADLQQQQQVAFGAASASPGAATAPGKATHGAANGTDLTKIVRDGSVSLTIENGTFDEKFARVTQIARASGGFVLSTQTVGSGSGSLVLRIPAKHFDAAVLAVRKLGTVTASQTTGKDVTAQYIDNQARLQILESQKAVLLTLMSRATTIGQTIAVENRLNDVQYKIEQIQGQLRYLDNQVAESTLTVDLREKDAHPAVVRSNDVRNPSLGHALDRAVQGFLNVLATVIVGLGYLIPIGILALLTFLVVVLVRRSRRVTSPS
ncbi:MAG: DUF4349 domain-containing protein [Planctomycetaceae bacterium]